MRQQGGIWIDGFKRLWLLNLRKKGQVFTALKEERKMMTRARKSESDPVFQALSWEFLVGSVL